MKSERVRNKYEKIPLWSIILLIIALLSCIILIVARQSQAFAVFFNKYISGAVRLVLASVTNFIPFSLAELFVILLPILLTLLIIYAIKKRSQSLRAIGCYFIILLSVASVIFSLFVFSYGVGYHVPTLYERFDIPKEELSVDDLRVTAIKLATETNNLSMQINYSENGASIMPYSLSDMNLKLMSSYKKASETYDFIQVFSSNIKPVLLSIPMSYTYTTGVYTFFSGEANLNVDFPDYTLPYTAAHEFAHQRGIARENEANFVAFLVGIESDDPYIRYSTYLNMFEYVASALYAADPNMYKDVYSNLSPAVKGEIGAYSAFFEKYRDSKAGEVSSAINNAYLIANGTTEGTRSYGLVVELAVAYFNGYIDKK